MTKEEERERFVAEESAKVIEWHASKGSKAYDMARAVKDNVKTWSIGKMGRWIGYAQCILVAEGAITLDEITREMSQIESASKEMYA